MRFTRNLRIATAALVALTAVVALSVASCNKGGGAASAEDEMTMGSATAPVTITEYASVSCSHCAAFNNDVFPAFKAKYIDTGQVRWVARESLVADPRMALAGFMIARCAGKDKYFKVTDAIYRSQPEVAMNLRAGLLSIAQSAGMNEQQFDQCLNDAKAIEAMDQRIMRQNRAAGVSGTPTFIVNNKIVASSEVTLAQMDQIVADARKLGPAAATMPAK